MVIWGVNASSRARRSISNPLITDNATDKANVPSVTPASEMMAISETNRSRRRARRYRSAIVSS